MNHVLIPALIGAIILFVLTRFAVRRDWNFNSTIPGKHLVLVLLALLLPATGYVWSTGQFDRALVDWGLNAKDCYQNAFGAKICSGDEGFDSVGQ